MKKHTEENLKGLREFVLEGIPKKEESREQILEKVLNKIAKCDKNTPIKELLRFIIKSTIDETDKIWEKKVEKLKQEIIKAIPPEVLHDMTWYSQAELHGDLKEKIDEILLEKKEELKKP